MIIYGMLNIAADTEKPLLNEIWDYFYNTYVDPNEYYENINMGTGTMLSLRIIILGLCIGLCAAAFAAVFNKRVLGGVVRKVLKSEAFSAESALTLEELGYESNPFVRLAVRKSTSLRRVLKCAEEEEFEHSLAQRRKEHEQNRKENKKLPKFKESSYKINAYADRFYIPEDMKYMADVKFEKKGSTWFGAIVFSLVMVVVFVAILVALPEILSLINDIAGGVSTKPKNII